MRTALYAALVLLFFVRFDLWLWDDGSILLGLPVGLLYQVFYCLAVTVVMALVVRYAWSEDLDEEDG